MSHNHHDGCCHGNPSVDQSMEMGILYSLYTKINTDEIECLNETVEGSGKTVFKPWENRLDTEQYVESDADEELLFNIPFTGNVKLKGIIVIGGDEDSHPSRIRLFKNRPHMNFDDINCESDQEFELCKDSNGTLEYNIKIVKFSNVYRLSLHFPKNFGSEKTKIYYIGLRGEYTATQRDAILLASYELAPNPAEHCKTDLFESAMTQIH